MTLRNLSIFLVLLSSYGLCAQQKSDTTRVIKDAAKGSDPIIIGIPANQGANARVNKSPMNPGDPDKLKPPKVNNIPKNDNSFSFAPQPLPKDVYQPKFWNGKDMSNAKIQTTQFLGKIEIETPTVRIECRDFAYVDGDRVRVYVNGKLKKSNVLLDGHFFIIELPLDLGYNQIDIQAMNQGLSGPNTAQFIVYDGNNKLISTKKWNLQTGQAASLSVIRKK